MVILAAPSPKRHESLTRRIMLTLVVLLAVLISLSVSAQAQEAADVGFSPASGNARVIAQGVVPLPEGEAVWRTVRTRAALPDVARFEPRPLGFVVATTGPLLLVDQDSGEQMQLGIGEAALTTAGSNLKLASLAGRPVSFLSIELVPVDAPPPPSGATVLQPGQPFAAPSGLRDLDLLIDTLGEGETFTIPNSGTKNVVLITDGAASVGRPGEASVVLLAGEAASFSGELAVALAPDGGSATTSFVVAMIGPELPAVQPVATGEDAEPTAAAQTTPQTGAGSITIQIYACPPGMTAETLNVAVCAPAPGEVAVTLSGAELGAPLTLADAERAGDRYTWSGLPFGEYVLAEELPGGYASYVLAARDTSGSAESGFRLTIDATRPEVAARIYNFASS